MSPRAERDGDTVRLTLEGFEADLLRSLPEALHALLDEPDPHDAAITRLFPSCVDGDDEADAEVRRLIFDDLLQSRLEALGTFTDVLARGKPRRGRIVVDLVEEEPGLFLGVLNDVRLTLGVRVGIEHLDRDEIDADHPAAQTLAVMDHLAWIQEELLRAVDPPSVEGT